MGKHGLYRKRLWRRGTTTSERREYDRFALTLDHTFMSMKTAALMLRKTHFFIKETQPWPENYGVPGNFARLTEVSMREAFLLLIISSPSFYSGQSISTLALDCLLLIQCHSTVTVYSHGY